jgi:hypothetical protein
LYIQHKKSAGMVIKTLPFTLLLILWLWLEIVHVEAV